MSSTYPARRAGPGSRSGAGSAGSSAGPTRSTNAINAFIHLYRAEVGRTTTYRRRLDTTTNWAVTSTAIVASFAFDRPEHSHASFLFLMMVNYFFLHLEARRFRAYEASRYRVRLLERYFFREVCGYDVPAQWTDRLFTALRNFAAPATDHWNALGWRLRSSYLWIYVAVLAAWLIKLDVLSWPTRSIVDGAALGSVPGGVVLAAVAAFYVFLLILVARTRGDEDVGDEEVQVRMAEHMLGDDDLPVY